MSVSRRKFLHHAFAAAACVAAPLQVWGSRQSSIDNNPAADNPRGKSGHGVSRAAFAGLIGASFKVTTAPGSAPVWLRLGAINDPPAIAPVNAAIMAVAPKSAAKPVLTTGYLVSFIGPGTSLPQGTYTFENDQLGSFPLFIVPDNPGETYTAVFNLLVAPAQGPSVGHPIRIAPVRPGKDTKDTRDNIDAPDTLGAPAISNATGVFGGSGRAVNLGAGGPAQQDVEPSLRRRLKTQLPE